MASAQGVPIVKIDPDGVFKYIIINVRSQTGSFDIVRGFAWAEYHDDMYQPVSGELEEMGFDTECTGGGRIQHKAAEKYLKVYGYSQAFGRGDHAKVVELLRASFPGYTLEWSNDGY